MELDKPEVAARFDVAGGSLGNESKVHHAPAWVAQERFDDGGFQAEAGIKHAESPGRAIEARRWGDARAWAKE